MIAFSRRSTMHISSNALGAFGREDWSMARFFGIGDDRGFEAWRLAVLSHRFRVSWSTPFLGMGREGTSFRGVCRIKWSAMFCVYNNILFFGFVGVPDGLGWTGRAGWLGQGGFTGFGETGVLCGELSALSLSFILEKKSIVVGLLGEKAVCFYPHDKWCADHDCPMLLLHFIVTS